MIQKLGPPTKELLNNFVQFQQCVRNLGTHWRSQSCERFAMFCTALGRSISRIWLVLLLCQPSQDIVLQRHARPVTAGKKRFRSEDVMATSGMVVANKGVFQGWSVHNSQNILKLFVLGLDMMNLSMKQSLSHKRSKNKDWQQHEKPRWWWQR